VPLAWRIALTVLAAFVVATAAAGVYLAVQVGRLAEQELEDSLLSDLDMMTPVVREDLTRSDHAALQDVAAAASRRGMVRVTVILPDGTVIAESEHRLPVASHSDRPEVVEAVRAGTGRAERKSTTTSEVYVYMARRVDAADGRPLGILRLARPKRTVEAIDRDLFRILGAAVLIGLPVAALVGWVAARRIARPLEEMTAAASRMASGDFTFLPRAAGVDEAGRLAAALGRLGLEFSSMLRVRDEQRAGLQAILGSMAEGVLAVGADGRVLLANPAAAECLGQPRVPEPGTPLQEIVRLPEITAQFRRALAGENAPEADVQMPGPAGRVLGIGAAAIRSESGEVRGAVLVLRDVTVIRRLERTRLDFVANVSHELRTPLAAVLSALETVADLGDDEPQMRAQLLATAARQGRRLNDIVDDLLALSQIESEGDRLERGPTPLLRSIRSAASAVAGEAKSRGIALVLPPADAAERTVLAHEGRLEQVWTNLLSNAVKYNRPGGTVTVTVASDDAGRMAEVAVSDTGQGIPAEHLPRIFERFYRVDKGRSREQGGTGLGLAIVRHIVVAHRGAIEVESRPGEGSTFRVRIPLDPSARPRGPSAS
jgi:two-component system phosphate regulon sensor histidine kinase PhoR